MNKLFRATVGMSVVLATGIVLGQGSLLEIVANKVIDKYQSATCEQLWQRKDQPKSDEEQRFVRFLRNDPQVRTAFLNLVAAPIANRMFECGMLP